MLDRFDPPARTSVELAAVEARRLGHPYVGTEHLMLGLLAEGRNPAALLLQSAGASLPACREKVSEALARRDLPPAPRDAADLTLTDRAARAIDRAGKLSLRLKSEYVGAAHLLTSVLDVEGTAGQVLRGLNVDLTVLRDELSGITADPDASLVREEPRSATVDRAPTPDATDVSAGDVSVGEAAGPVEPVCAGCGTPLASSLAHATVAAADGVRFDVVYCSSCGTALGASPG